MAAVAEPTAIASSPAAPKTRRPRTQFGGLLDGDQRVVALSEEEVKAYAILRGIDKAAATNWLRAVRGNSSADYKVNKTYEHKIKIQINPFFVAVHVAALQHKGIQFTWEQLATDLLHIHDPIIVKPLLDASPDSQTSLETLHEKCVAHFAAWFRDDLLQRYSPSSLLAATSRAASDTENVLDLPDHLAAPHLRSAMACRLLENAGRQVQERDSQPSDQTCQQL